MGTSLCSPRPRFHPNRSIPAVRRPGNSGLRRPCVHNRPPSTSVVQRRIDALRGLAQTESRMTVRSLASAPAALSWIEDRFRGMTAPTNCSSGPPVESSSGLTGDLSRSPGVSY